MQNIHSYEIIANELMSIFKKLLINLECTDNFRVLATLDVIIPQLYKKYDPRKHREKYSKCFQFSQPVIGMFLSEIFLMQTRMFACATKSKHYPNI